MNNNLPDPVVFAGPNEAILFYNRPDGIYDGYELHIWNNGQCDAYTDEQMEGIAWTSGVVIEGYDPNYGAYYVVDLKDGVTVEDVELVLGEMCNVVKNTYGDDQGGFIAGQVYKYSGFVSAEGTVGDAPEENETAAKIKQGELAIVTFWKSFEQHEKSHADRVFKEKFDALVEFCDGSLIAQLGSPDMRLPIQYALTYPERCPFPAPRLDLTRDIQLDLEPPDEERFPALPLGKEVARRGGTARRRPRGRHGGHRRRSRLRAPGPASGAAAGAERFDRRLAAALGKFYPQLVAPEVAEGVHPREHVDLDRAHPLGGELRQAVAPAGLVAGVGARPAPEHEVDVGLGGGDAALEIEGPSVGDRRNRGVGQVDHAGGAARGRGGRSAGKVSPQRKAGVGEVDCTVDQARQHQTVAEVDPWRCRGCGRIYWKGSHFEKLQALIEAVL